MVDHTIVLTREDNRERLNFVFFLILGIPYFMQWVPYPEQNMPPRTRAVLYAICLIVAAVSYFARPAPIVVGDTSMQIPCGLLRMERIRISYKALRVFRLENGIHIATSDGDWRIPGSMFPNGPKEFADAVAERIRSSTEGPLYADIAYGNPSRRATNLGAPATLLVALATLLLALQRTGLTAVADRLRRPIALAIGVAPLPDAKLWFATILVVLATASATLGWRRLTALYLPGCALNALLVPDACFAHHPVLPAGHAVVVGALLSSHLLTDVRRRNSFAASPLGGITFVVFLTQLIAYASDTAAPQLPRMVLSSLLCAGILAGLFIEPRIFQPRQKVSMWPIGLVVLYFLIASGL